MATAKKAATKQAITKLGTKTARKAPSTKARKPYPDNTPENTKPPRMKDAVDLLADDHLAAGKCFKQYETLAKKGGAADQRKALASKVCGMLKVHMVIEEEIFYPAARDAGLEHDMMDEADVEHDGAKGLIVQIESSNPGDDHYDAKVKVLGDIISHHVIEEHTEMFPKCRRSKMDLAGLRVAMAARKKELEASPPMKPRFLSRLGS